MGVPERDLNGVAVLLGGLPTVTFRAAPYHRSITGLVVSNGVSGTVNVYRGLLGSLPVASSPLGNNNTFQGRIALPAGQQLFIQWTNAASPVSLATARMSSERDDNPLDVDPTSGGWQESQAISLSLGNPPAQIVLGQSIPTELVTFYSTYLGGSFTVNAVILMYADANNYFYIADLTRTLGSVAWARGLVSTGAIVHEIELIYGFGPALMFLGNAEAINLTFGNVTNPSSWAFINTDVSLSTTSPFSIDNHSAPRGIVTSASLVVPGVGPLGAETQFWSFNSITYRNGRVYGVDYDIDCFGSIENVSIYKLHYNNALGALIDVQLKENPAGTTFNTHSGRFCIMNDTGSDITRTIVMTATPNAGTISLSNGNTSRGYIQDIGSVADLNGGLAPIALV